MQPVLISLKKHINYFLASARIITISIPIIHENQFIGVIGSDISMTDMQKFLYNVNKKIYKI